MTSKLRKIHAGSCASPSYGPCVRYVGGVETASVWLSRLRFTPRSLHLQVEVVAHATAGRFGALLQATVYASPGGGARL